jgi:hypothetical protein
MGEAEEPGTCPELLLGTTAANRAVQVTARIQVVVIGVTSQWLERYRTAGD